MRRYVWSPQMVETDHPHSGEGGTRANIIPVGSGVVAGTCSVDAMARGVWWRSTSPCAASDGLDCQNNDQCALPPRARAATSYATDRPSSLLVSTTTPHSWSG